MAGIFGDEINSREDFFSELARAIANNDALIARLPREGLLKSISKQLDAIVGWTKDGRAPTIPERKRILMGIQAFREYEMTDDDGLSDHRDRLGGLNTYVKHWPEDSAARDPNNDQYLFTPWYD